MKKFLGSLLAMAALMSSAATAAPASDLEGLVDLVQRFKDATQHPSGTAVAVVKDGKLVYEGYFGYADINARTRVDRDTSFYIASTTKPFFALNILLKENEGKLDTTTSLQDAFPGIGFNGFDATAVTIRDLLVHTSGVDNQPLVWATAFSGIHNARSRHGLVANSYPAADAPRGTFKYTNVGYNILSVWLDDKFQTPWQDQLQDSIFSPLGMARTSAYISEAEAKGWPLAKPYSVAGVDRNEPLYLRKSDDTMQAAGGLVSTAPDLARFLIAQLEGGRLDGRQVLPESVIGKSHAPQAKADKGYLDFERTGYAWGWYTGAYKGRQMLHHFGAFPGFHAHLSFIPEAGIGLVVLNNEDFLGAHLSSLIADYAYGVLLDEPDIQSKVSARLDELLQKAAGLQKTAASEQQKIQGRAWDLSLPHRAYAGTYSNDLLGDMTVAVEGDRQMVIRWGKLTAVAAGYDRKDHVRVEFSPHSGDLLTFVLKADKADAITFEGMTFKKAP